MSVAYATQSVVSSQQPKESAVAGVGQQVSLGDWDSEKHRLGWVWHL